jgi:hypothetical protein
MPGIVHYPIYPLLDKKLAPALRWCRGKREKESVRIGLTPRFYFSRIRLANYTNVLKLFFHLYAPRSIDIDPD